MQENQKAIKPSKIASIIPFLAVPTVIYFILNFPFNNSSSILGSIGLTIPQIESFENKLLFLSRILIVIAWIFGLQILLTIIFRVATLTLPIKHQDSGYVEVLNRCLRTTLEQSVAFITLFAYVLLQFGNEKNISVLYMLAVLWFTGRILFIIGYILGYRLNILTLRTIGLEMNLFVTLILGAKALQTGHFKYIV